MATNKNLTQQLQSFSAILSTNSAGMVVSERIINQLSKLNKTPAEIVAALDDIYGKHEHDNMLNMALEGHFADVTMLDLTKLSGVLGIPLIMAVPDEGSKILERRKQGALERMLRGSVKITPGSQQADELFELLKKLGQQEQEMEATQPSNPNRPSSATPEREEDYKTGDINPDCCRQCRIAFNYFESQRPAAPDTGIQADEIAAVRSEVQAELDAEKAAPQPLFEIGQEVAFSTPENPIGKVTVSTVEHRYFKSYGQEEPHWNYKMAGQPDDRSWPESAVMTPPTAPAEPINFDTTILSEFKLKLLSGSLPGTATEMYEMLVRAASIAVQYKDNNCVLLVRDSFNNDYHTVYSSVENYQEDVRRIQLTDMQRVACVVQALPK